MPKTYMDWPDPEIKYEGVHLPLEYRPKKKKKHHFEGSALEGIAFAICLGIMVFGMYICLL